MTLSQHPEAIRSRRRRAEASARYLGPDPASHARAYLEVLNGTVIIGSDAHYWPGDPSTAHRAFTVLIGRLNPQSVILNGDIIDGARVSRWAPGHWDDMEHQPTLIEEVAVAQERMAEIAKAAGDVPLFWPMGNHDSRFEKYLLEHAPEALGIPGTRLKDHFPAWTPCWDVMINDEGDAPVLVKHRFKGGEYAARNNTIKAGVTIVTGHLHSLGVEPFSDLRGTRWGVDCGTLAVPHGKQFINYTEDNPVNWRSGFVVLTFVGGRLLWPEICFVMDEAKGLVCFRGKVMEV